MDRREAMTTVGALALAAFSGVAGAEEHQHHHDHGSGPRYQGLIDSTSACLVKGEVCLAHCLVLLGEGDKSMAECATSVNQMLAVCGALQRLAIQDSRLVAAVAKVALDACVECEKNCKKHADKHAQCKACMEACADCARQCKQFAA